MGGSRQCCGGLARGSARAKPRALGPAAAVARNRAAEPGRQRLPPSASYGASRCMVKLIAMQVSMVRLRALRVLGIRRRCIGLAQVDRRIDSGGWRRTATFPGAHDPPTPSLVASRNLPRGRLDRPDTQTALLPRRLDLCSPPIRPADAIELEGGEGGEGGLPLPLALLRRSCALRSIVGPRRSAASRTLIPPL